MRSEVGMQWEGSVLNQASFFTSVLHEHCLTQGWVRTKDFPLVAVSNEKRWA